MLGDEQRKTIILFTDAIAALCAPSQDAAKIEHLKEQVNVALARLERDFPLSLQVRLQCKCLKSIVSWVLLLLETKTFLVPHLRQVEFNIRLEVGCLCGLNIIHQGFEYACDDIS